MEEPIVFDIDFYIDLVLKESFIMSELVILREFADQMKKQFFEAFLDKESYIYNLFKDEVNKRKLEAVNINLNQIVDQIEDDYWHELEEYSNIKDTFPNLFRLSFFVFSYAFLETHIINILGWFEDKYKVKISDLKGKGIFLARNYLTKIVNIKFPENSIHWNNIIYYNKLRNTIVHNLGKINDETYYKNELMKYININSKFISIQNHKIQFSDGFLFEVIDNIDKFFQEIFSVINQRITQK